MAALQMSKRLILTYLIDWIVIVAIIAVGAAVSNVSPYKRPFDLADRTISFPYVAKEQISTATLVVVALIAPAVIIFIIALIVYPGPSNDMTKARPSSLRHKLWEVNVGWMGLALSIALSFFLTNGIKNLVGKPRPDLLGRCDPDFSKVLTSTVGGVGRQLDEGINLVSWTVCRNPGATLDDGFRSFPSGHSSFSFAGLIYLALFLCNKFDVAIPSLNHTQLYQQPESSYFQAAAAPTFLLLLPLIPISTAIFICTTRYAQFYHHGFDIIFGAALGAAAAWFGFRWYYPPIGRGVRWSWAPRQPHQPFFGGGNLTSPESPERNRDPERGFGAKTSQSNNESQHPIPLQQLADS